MTFRVIGGEVEERCLYLRFSFGLGPFRYLVCRICKRYRAVELLGSPTVPVPARIEKDQVVNSNDSPGPTCVRSARGLTLIRLAGHSLSVSLVQPAGRSRSR